MDEIRFTCAECHGKGFTEDDGLKMLESFVCTPCLYGTSYEEYYGFKSIPHWQKVLGGHVLMVLIVMAILLAYNFYPTAPPSCTDGTWIYEQSIEDFVCVKDDGVYTPPVD